MKTLKELEDECEDSNENFTDLACRELRSQNNFAMNIFIDILIDWCNCHGRMELMYEIFSALIEDEFKASFDVMLYSLVDGMMKNNGTPEYAPTDEKEMDKLLDMYQKRKKDNAEWERRHIEEFGIEWLTMTGEERLLAMMERMQKDSENNPQDNKPPEINNEDNPDYPDLPF